jgi:hypothetical protein
MAHHITKRMAGSPGIGARCVSGGLCLRRLVNADSSPTDLACTHGPHARFVNPPAEGRPIRRCHPVPPLRLPAVSLHASGGRSRMPERRFHCSPGALNIGFHPKCREVVLNAQVRASRGSAPRRTGWTDRRRSRTLPICRRLMSSCSRNSYNGKNSLVSKFVSP